MEIDDLSFLYYICHKLENAGENLISNDGCINDENVNIGSFTEFKGIECTLRAFIKQEEGYIKASSDKAEKQESSSGSV